jgi:hypothetical protein
MNITERQPVIEFDEDSLAVRWVSDDKSESFSVAILSGKVVGIHCHDGKANTWSIPLPKGLVRIEAPDQGNEHAYI